MVRSFLPSHPGNPFAVAWEVLRSRDAAAYAALWQTALGVAAMPVDLLLRPAEARRYALADAPKRPQVFVCGPPRSGTTLVSQALLGSAGYSCFNNLMSLFPGAPITASKVFGRFVGERQRDFTAFYGKTRALSGPNDSLYLWDRWVGDDRSRFPATLADSDSARLMQHFFGAWEAVSPRPVLNKNNRLNGYAHLVAPHLPNALFICMTREPLHLAQSLYVARERITRDTAMPYGAVGEEYRQVCQPDDPLRDVCLQVEHYERLAEQQQQAIGTERFWRVSYEEFCANPQALIERVAAFASVRLADDGMPASFTPSTSNRLPEALVGRIAEECGALGLSARRPFFA